MKSIFVVMSALLALMQSGCTAARHYLTPANELVTRESSRVVWVRLVDGEYINFVGEGGRIIGAGREGSPATHVSGRTDRGDSLDVPAGRITTANVNEERTSFAHTLMGYGLVGGAVVGGFLLVALSSMNIN